MALGGGPWKMSKPKSSKIHRSRCVCFNVHQGHSSCFHVASDFIGFHHLSHLSSDCSLSLEPLGGLAGINCHCQWGLTGLLGGIVIMLAAGQGVPKKTSRAANGRTAFIWGPETGAGKADRLPYSGISSHCIPEVSLTFNLGARHAA